MTYNKNDWESHDLITTGKMNNIEDGIQTALERATFGHGGAEMPSEGLHIESYINLGDPMPPNPLSGDIVYVKDGDDYIIYQYDGAMWVLQVNPKFAQRLQKNLLEAKAQTETLISENQVNVDKTINEVKEEQKNLQDGLNNLDTNAQDYANKALADARADIATTAAQTAKTASDALATAKTDLTTSLNKEVTDRANAVTALDTKAKGYADTAKADAISAGATADGVINKKIDDTASSITSTISQNKTDADGKITTAQSTATQALNGLATKVSQTVYDAKTGQLQTDLNTTTTTANQAKTDIVAIKSDNTKQDARMTTIESDANGVKTTVSNLQTDLGKANGSISTLQQRADGFDATVTKVNGLGQINQIVNSEFTPDMSGWYDRGASATQVLAPAYGTPINGSNVYAPSPVPFSRLQSAPVAVTPGMVVSYSVVKTGTYWSYLNASDAKGNIINVPGTNSDEIAGSNTYSTGYTKIENITIPAGVSYVSLGVWIEGFTAISQPMLVFSATVGTYVAGNYNNNASVAKAQLTADQAITSLNNYKTDADGRISKAQADIIVNAGAITQKVSQSDYNAKTGDLTTKVNTAQSTADSATSTIGAYKTSNDARVASAESKITANATAITQKVSQTDYNTKTGQIDAQISTINQTAGQISQSVSDVKAQVSNLSVGGRNLVLGTEKDTAWTADSKSNWSFNVIKTGLKPGQTYTFSAEVTLGNTDQKIATVSLFNEPIGQYLASNDNFKADGTRDHWTFTVPTTVNTPTASLIIYAGTPGSTGGKSATYHHIKLETGNMPSDWTPAPEDTDNKISTVSQTVDSISSIVSDPTTGLTKRVQTAEGTLSQVTGTDIPSLQKATYWQAPNGYDLNTYLAQGSTFFRDTTARTNAPTTSTKWMYLVVERTPNGDRVTQTAWYDTPTDAKITYRRIFAGTWGPWYANDNDSVATIAQTNGAIQQEVKDRTNGDSNTLTQAKNFTTSSITSSETGMKSLITQTSDSILGKVGAVNLFPNSEFEKDYGYAVLNGNTTLSLGVKNTVDGHLNGTVNVVSTTTAYQGYWARNISVYGGHNYSASVLVHYVNNNVIGGNAYLDIWYVDQDGNRISRGDNVKGSSGAVEQGSNAWWVKLTYEGTAPINAVYLQVNLLVNNAGAGQTAMFTQPMVTATEKLQPYTPNNDITTQLALLKDNWSIGINDNVGKLASGIAADANAMAVVSPKVIINSPQTQITGKLTAAQIDTKELSALSANLGNVSSGSITNPINQAWSAGTGATLLGTTVIDNRGINMNADIKTASNPKLYSETVSISPDTGIKFSWRDYTGGTVLPPVPLDMSMSSAGIVASSGKQYVSIVGNSITADNETAGTATTMSAMVSNPDGGINAGGAQSSAYIRYVTGQNDTQNLPLVMGLERIGNIVMVSFNFVTYGSTIRADAIQMNGPKIPVGFRPVDNVHIQAHANNGGTTIGTITFTITPDGKVLQTSPAINGIARIMGSATYLTYMIGAQAGFVVKDAQGNTTW